VGSASCRESALLEVSSWAALTATCSRGVVGADGSWLETWLAPLLRYVSL
jgi:hypothetical protein